MDASCFALELPGSKPFLVLASGMLPERLTRRGRSSTLYTSSPKARALARASDLALQACTRATLAFLVKVGRGKRWRSWYSAEQIADLLPRSAEMPNYSKHHVRRAIRQLGAAGLARCVRVKPGECFPDKDTPDLDGGGIETDQGGNVIELNVDALLGRGPVWLPAPPQAPQPAVGDDDGLEGPPETFPGLPERPVEPNPAPASGPSGEVLGEVERVIIDDAGRVIIHDASSDRSPSEILKSDPAPTFVAAAPAAPASNTRDVGPSQSSGPCEKGASETPGSPIAAPALHLVQGPAPPAPQRRSNENEKRGREAEHEKCHGWLGPPRLRPIRLPRPDKPDTPCAKVIRPPAFNPVMSAEDMQRDLERLFGPGKPPEGSSS